MTNKIPYPLGVLFVRGLVLPVSLLIWVAVIVAAAVEKPDESKTAFFETLTRIVFSGNQ